MEDVGKAKRGTLNLPTPPQGERLDEEEKTVLYYTINSGANNIYLYNHSIIDVFFLLFSFLNKPLEKIQMISL